MKLEIMETCCRFGEHGSLAGLITEPASGAARGAVVLVTAGLTPKFGPFRLYAQLARRLATEGFLTLRFDLGGIGDSGTGRAELPLARRTELEIRAAVEHVLERGAFAGVTLGGLCSGAEDSLRYAELDPRITGLVLMDPFGYKTLGWKARDLPIRLLRLTLWKMGLLPTYGGASNGDFLIDYKHMEHPESSRILRTMVERGVPMHFVYTGGMHESFNHKRQFKAMFPGIDFKGKVTLDYYPRLRHTQPLEADRRLVIGSITGALLARAPAA